MPERTPACQLGAATAPDSRLISPRPGGTPCHQTEHTIGTQGLHVPPHSQWLHTTSGRIATDPYSWMQAVHWVAGSGLYTPSRSNGPKFGPTTIAIAQEIAALAECRPGVDYLARKLKISERTVQYHLGMLRETGLLVYRSKGTRVSGVGGRASVFERIIPTAFDQALGIRTIGEGATRRPVGAAPEHRSTLGKLAKKAARKVRRRPRRKPVSGQGRCTPMQGGTSSSSSTSLTRFPSESKLASGESESTTRKSAKRGPRKLNKVGRRHQLARELKQMVPWLSRASVPRLAWIVRHCADAGWTALEVQAAAEQMPVSKDDARRPSGLLAWRLAGCHQLYNTPARRKTMYLAWQESRASEQARHTGYDHLTTDDRGPASVSVQRLYAAAARRVQEIATGPVDDADCHSIDAETGEGTAALEDFDRDFIRTIRAEAERDLTQITRALETGMTETDARRFYTNWLVDQALAAQQTAVPAF